MKENERSIAEREKLPKEFYISGAVSVTITIGALVGLLIHSTKAAEREYRDENLGFLPRVERLTGDSPDKLFSQIVEDEDPAKFLARAKLNIVPQAVQVEQEVQRPSEVTSSEIVSGKATYYGVDDGYGLEDSLGCTGEPFDPYDPKTAARPETSPFVCGDRLEVCDADSCIEVEIRDTCPGCDDWGIVIDLSYGAMGKLTGEHGTAMVTIRKK